MPARRKRNKKKNIKPTFNKVRLGLFAVAVLGMVLAYWLIKSLNSGIDYFTIAVAAPPDIHIWAVNIKEGEIVKVIVPADTEVNLAMQRGTLRAQSVWKLVESEDLPGQILADTVMRTFHTPVDYWAMDSALNNLLDKRTDIPLFLRIKTVFLSKRKTPEVINLNETSVLISSKLTDGQEGYSVSGNLPVSLISRFSDSNISESQIAARVTNSTGEATYQLNNVVGVLEVLGAKVAPITTSDVTDLDCIVKSDETDVLERIARVFNCEKVDAAPEAFDVEIILGKKFLERF